MMEDLQKNIRINQLFDLYGSLLTVKQQKMIELYYQMDLSLGEISEQEKISRNAVYDSLTKTIKILETYEEKLGLLKKQVDLENYFSLLKENKSEEEKELINEIERKVDL